MTHSVLWLAPIACALLTSAASAAEPAPAKPVTFEVELGAVSDYRYRGLSLSDGDPAVQGGLTATLRSGVYGNVWGSTIEEYGAGADGKGAKVEVDGVVGWAGTVGGLDVDVSAQLYAYPGGSHVNYVEFPVSVSRAVGDWTLSAGAAYAPSQRALGHEDNTYGWGAVAWGGDSAPLKVELRAGYEHGAYAPGGKWDWSAGVTRSFGPLTAGLAYVDSDEPASSAALVASLVATF